MGINYFEKSRTADLFEEFIYNYNHTLFCKTCNYSFILNNASFCPICGSNQLKKGIFKEKMIYKSEIELDENKKAKICPRCGNEEIIEGNHCKICGLELYNRCTNYIEDGYGHITDRLC